MNALTIVAIVAGLVLAFVAGALVFCKKRPQPVEEPPKEPRPDLGAIEGE